MLLETGEGGRGGLLRRARLTKTIEGGRAKDRLLVIEASYRRIISKSHAFWDKDLTIQIACALRNAACIVRGRDSLARKASL